jgi:hypothetical protein
MGKKEELLDRIDNLAVEICHLMPECEKEDFFSWQEYRHNSKEGYNKKYFVGRTYYKGKKKGEVRDVFDVDGRGFNNLWKLLNAFAAKTVNSFYNTRRIFSEEEFEDLFDIRYQTLYVLRFFGPTPNGVSFSKFFPLICKNILSTSSRRRYGTKEIIYSKDEGEELINNGRKNLKFNPETGNYTKKDPANRTKINYHTVSLYNTIMVEEDDDGSNCIINMLPSTDNDYSEIEFWASIPDEMKPVVEKIVEGNTLNASAKDLGLKPKKVRKELEELVADFYE